MSILLTFHGPSHLWLLFSIVQCLYVVIPKEPEHLYLMCSLPRPPVLPCSVIRLGCFLLPLHWSFPLALFFPVLHTSVLMISLQSPSVYRVRYSSIPGVYIDVPPENYVPQPPDTPVHMLTSNFVSLITFVVPHRYFVQRILFPQLPYSFSFSAFSSFPLFMRTLQFCVLFRRPLSPHDFWISTMSRSHVLSS